MYHRKCWEKNVCVCVYIFTYIICITLHYRYVIYYSKTLYKYSFLQTWLLLFLFLCWVISSKYLYIFLKLDFSRILLVASAFAFISESWPCTDFHYTTLGCFTIHFLYMCKSLIICLFLLGPGLYLLHFCMPGSYKSWYVAGARLYFYTHEIHTFPTIDISMPKWPLA